MARKKTTSSSGYEKSIELFSKKIKPILSEDEAIMLTVAAGSVLSGYAQCLNVQYSGLNSNRDFTSLQDSIEKFFADLNHCNSPIEKMDIFSYLLEAMEKCKSCNKKLQKDILTAKKQALRRLANARPLIPFSEEFDRELDQYRDHPKYQ